MEAHGGAGYIEEGVVPRIFRQSPLNSIWEGSGNVICLDVLRAIARSPQSLEIFLSEVQEAAAAEPRLARFVADLKSELADFDEIETRARRVVEAMAIALQGSLV